MRNSYRVARIGGINIFVHWSWFLAVAFITFSLGDYYHHLFPHWSSGTTYVVGAISALLLFATVLIHELAHSFTARANNLPVREITLFIFGGVSNLTQEPQTPKIELMVAIAGPLASAILAGLFYVLYLVLQNAPSEIDAALGYLAWVNVILAVFNLIPGFPLDGGRVLRAIIWLVTGNLRRSTHIASNVGQAIGYLFILGGVLEALVLRDVSGGIWLAFIGWFLHNSASASYQQAVMDRVLTGVDVRTVMDRLTNTTPPDVPIDAIVYQHLLGQSRTSVAVVDADGTLLGLITIADLNKISRQEWYAVPVGRVMTPLAELCTVTPDQDLRSALRTLAENDYHQLPVVEDGKLVGMLNRSHVVQYVHERRQLASTVRGRTMRRPDDRDHTHPRAS